MKISLTIILIPILIAGILQFAFYDYPKTSDNYIQLSEGKLVYKEYGAGTNTIILIHGSPGNKGDFEHLGPEIKDRKVYALDMYGFGESEKDVKNYGTRNSARVIAEFMDAKAIDSADILGYSWGGATAIDFTYYYPQKTKNLIMLSSMGIMEGETSGNYFVEQFRYSVSYPFAVYYPSAFLIFPNKNKEKNCEEYLSCVQTRKGFMRSFMDTDQRTFREKLSKISSKTLILHGSNDTVIEPWVAEEHARLIPDAELVFYNGGHGKIFSNTTEMSQLLNNFLRENEI